MNLFWQGKTNCKAEKKRQKKLKRNFFIDFQKKMSIIAPLCSLNIEMNRGRVAEWSKAAVLKTVDVYASVGSNPTSSARICGEVSERPKELAC